MKLISNIHITLLEPPPDILQYLHQLLSVQHMARNKPYGKVQYLLLFWDWLHNGWVYATITSISLIWSTQKVIFLELVTACVHYYSVQNVNISADNKAMMIDQLTITVRRHLEVSPGSDTLVVFYVKRNKTIHFKVNTHLVFMTYRR